jgi:PAS domain S-box-containing protein
MSITLRTTLMFVITLLAEASIMIWLSPRWEGFANQSSVALLDGLALGALVGAAHWALGLGERRRAKGDRAAAGRAFSAIVASVILAALALTCEATLHVLIVEYGFFENSAEEAVVNAFIAACIVCAATAWLAFIDRLVEQERLSGEPRLRTLGAPLLAGAVLVATCVTAVPVASAVNNALMWQRGIEGASLLNLSGRQRMLSQRIGRLAALDTLGRAGELRETIATMDAQGGRLRDISTRYLARNRRAAADTDVAAQMRAVEAARASLLTEARRLTDPAATADPRALQREVDRFLPLMEAATASFERIETQRLTGHASGQMARLMVGPFLLFGLALGLLWPILRLVAAQRLHLADQARVVALTRNPIVLVDADLRVTWVNDAFVQMTGYSVEEAIGAPPIALLKVGEADPEALAAVSEAIDKGGVFRRTAPIRTKDGRLLWLDVDMQPLKDAKGAIEGYQVVGTDVTAFLMATVREAELLERATTREALMENMAAVAGVGGWELDLATDRFETTAELRRLHEIDETFDATLANSSRFYPQPGRAAIARAVAEARAQGTPWTLELPFRTAKGRELWVRTSGRAQWRDGKPAILTGAVVDITQERAAREEMAQAMARADRALGDLTAYQTALDRHAGVAIVDDQGRFLFVNDLLCEMVGHAREELIGAPYTLMRGQGDADAAMVEFVRKMAAGESWRAEMLEHAKDGRPVWLDATVAPMMDSEGRPERYVAVCFDITAKKEADDKLRLALGQLSQFFDVSPDMLCITDRLGHWLRVSRAASVVLGWEPEALTGRRFMDFVHPDDLGHTEWAMDQLREHGRLVDFVNRYVRADGGVASIEWRAALVDGQVYAAARDVTEKLAHQGELERARDAAQAANMAKSAFLANMSHEIRTPLNGVVGVAGALARTDLTAEQREMVGLIQGSGETLERLLSDILDVSKIEAGRLDLHLEPFDLAGAVEAAAQVMAEKAQEKGVAFSLDIAPEARGGFLGDVLRVRQIVSNLASNAVKFTEAGAVRVAVTVLDSAPGEPSTVEIAVEDTGIGFDEETGRRLFTRFEQADGSITRSFGGTGLGLAICKSLANLMGGDMAATSTPGVGSRFTLRAPMMRCALATPDAQPAQGGRVDPQDGRALRVLLAEDHPVNQRVVTMILAPMGVEVTIAQNGVEAVAACEQATFDLILMDMQMPEMDGLTATRRIRAREGRLGLPATPIAMLSANAMKDHVDQALAAGCDVHIAKPVSPEALLNGMERALARVGEEPASMRAQDAAG